MDRQTSQQQQSQYNQQNQQGSQTQQSSGEQRSGASSDQQRNIATSRESGTGAQSAPVSSRSTGVARQQNRSPLHGDRGALSDPFTLMQRMSADMDRLFEQFGFGSSLGGSSLTTPSYGGTSFGASAWSPQIETFRRGDELVIRADVPGVRKEDLHVEVDDGVLTLSGERRSENEENRDGYYRSERSYGQFERAIALPEGVEADQCKASFNDGVLEVTLPAPKEQPRKTKRIEIR
jgi:HSP20 family protein